MKVLALIAVVLVIAWYNSEPDKSLVGYDDGWASGYNSECNIRETFIHADWGNSTYKSGFEKGQSDGMVACRRGPEVCLQTDDEYLEAALENIDLLLKPTEGRLLLTWVYGYYHQLLPGILKFSENYAEAKGALERLTATCTVIAIHRSVYRRTDAAEIAAMGPVATRALKNALSAAFVRLDHLSHPMLSAERAEEELRHLGARLEETLRSLP